MIKQRKRILVIVAIGVALTLNMTRSLEGQINLAEEYPQLSETPLADAQITSLPEDIILQTDNISITSQDVQTQLQSVPEQNRHHLANNELFIVEQMVTELSIAAQAKNELTRQGVDITEYSEQDLIQIFFASLTEDLEISEKKVSDFYNGNLQMMGGMSLEEATPQIEQFIMQQKQQSFVEQYIENIMSNLEVQLSESWVEEKVSMTLDNELDRARVSGKPTCVTFDSGQSETYQQLQPTFESLDKELEGEANLVIVSVEDFPILANRYQVQSIPTIIFFNPEGKETGRTNQPISEDQIKQNLQIMLE